MKAKVTIENGEAEIVLTAETEFEKTLIKNGKNDRLEIVSTAFRHRDYGYSSDHEARIVIRLGERPQDNS